MPAGCRTVAGVQRVLALALVDELDPALEDLKHLEVAAARALGANDAWILRRHLLPNVLPPIVVVATFSVARTIIAEASLSFLGLGIPAPEPTWGAMLDEGRNYITTGWWLALFPGLAIPVVVLGINLVGDWLRDVLGPRLERGL